MTDALTVDQATDKISDIIQSENPKLADRPVVIDPPLEGEGTNLQETADRISAIAAADEADKKAEEAKQNFFDEVEKVDLPPPPVVDAFQDLDGFSQQQKQIDIAKYELAKSIASTDWDQEAKTNPGHYKLLIKEVETSKQQIEGYQRALNEAIQQNQVGVQEQNYAAQRQAIAARDSQLASAFPQLAEADGQAKFIAYLKEYKNMNDRDIQVAYQTWPFEKIAPDVRKCWQQKPRAKARLKVNPSKPTVQASTLEKRVAQRMKQANVTNPHSLHAAEIRISELQRAG